MFFRTIFKEMKENGVKAKLPSWGGYWYWDNEKETIMMHTKDGNELDIRETEIVETTIMNTFSSEWIIATNENCPQLGGIAKIDFKEAIKYVLRGIHMSRLVWKHNDPQRYIELDTDGKIKLVVYNGEKFDWNPTESDLTAEDWIFNELQSC